MRAQSSPTLQPSPVCAGDVLAGKYVVERVVGSGGMGVVVQAMHQTLRQRVALKFLHERAASDAESVGRFLREGQAAAQLKSEHVARVSDVGALDNGTPYIVMEFLEGEDLASVLAREKRLSLATAVDYLLQASEAVAEAHRLGIVHRDLKPSNLFITEHADGSKLVKVLDFGISKMRELDGVPSLTATSQLIGSPQYMSPEQMRSAKHVDQRSDIWSIGMILFESLSGRPAYEAGSFAGLCGMVVSDAPVPLDGLHGLAPTGVRDAIRRCLAKNPDGRYASLAELSTDLAPFGSPRATLLAERIVTIARGPGGTGFGARDVASLTGQQPSVTAPSVSGRFAVSQEPAATCDIGASSPPRYRAVGAFLAGLVVVSLAGLWMARSQAVPESVSVVSDSTGVTGRQDDADVPVTPGTQSAEPSTAPEGGGHAMTDGASTDASTADEREPDAALEAGPARQAGRVPRRSYPASKATRANSASRPAPPSPSSTWSLPDLGGRKY